MNDYIDNVKINDLDNYSLYKDIYEKMYSFLSNNTLLSNESIIYIASLVVDKICSSNDDIMEILYKKYNDNKTLLSKYYPNINYSNKKDLLHYINNNKSYVLFEDINLSNIDYYCVLWESIFS